MPYRTIIETDNKWREFKTGDDVPRKTLRTWFDWLPEDAQGFILHKRHWMHVSQFERYPSEDGKWDLSHAHGMTGGWVLKISKNGEKYKIGSWRVVGY